MSSKLIKGLAVVGAAVLMNSSAFAGWIAFTNVGVDQFFVPIGVTSVDVLVVGGGGGGANGHQGGGGAGRVVGGTFAVVSGSSIGLFVGAGGNGALTDPVGNNIVGLTAGGASSFGAFLTATGGGVVTGINQGGHNGSSGGGAACNGGSLGGAGGSGGSNGQTCQSGFSMPIGLGQGPYAALLATYTEAVLSAGAGGLGGTGSHAGGGGAGGVLLNGIGPSAANGAQVWSGRGGIGYGAGGGAGGLDFLVGQQRWAGGNGASGLVYIEWADAVGAPVPGALALLVGGLFGLGIVRRRRRV